jgi:hypothetical protein
MWTVMVLPAVIILAEASSEATTSTDITAVTTTSESVDGQRSSGCLPLRGSRAVETSMKWLVVARSG